MNPTILNDYVEYLSTIKGRSNGTITEYTYDISNFLKFITASKNSITVNAESLKEISILNFKTDELVHITLKDIHAYMTFLDRVAHNSTSTRARKIASIKSFFKYVVNIRKIMKINPAELLDTPAKSSRNPVYLTLDESIQLIQSVETTKNEIFRTRDRAILVLFLNCGLRLSELASINIDKIRANNTLQVVGKGDKERTIYLNEASMEAITDYLRIRPDVQNEPALFLSMRKSRLSTRAIQHRVEHYLKIAGFDTNIYSTHKLRHTAATLMFKYGEVDIRILQEILGHESVSTTQIYTHLDDEGLRSAVSKNPLNIKSSKKDS